MRHKSKWYGILSLVALSLYGSACGLFDNPVTPTVVDPAPSPPPQRISRSLPIVYAAQQTQVWCWAAVSQMVLGYYNVGSVGQCNILTRWTGAPCCTAALPICIQAAPDLAFIQATLLEAGGIRSARVRRPLQGTEVIAEINGNRPFIIAYQGSFSGHVVVVGGYSINQDGSGLSVDVLDPFYGVYRGVPYATTFSYGAQLVWVDTLAGLQR